MVDRFAPAMMLAVAAAVARRLATTSAAAAAPGRCHLATLTVARSAPGWRATSAGHSPLHQCAPARPCDSPARRRAVRRRLRGWLGRAHSLPHADFPPLRHTHHAMIAHGSGLPMRPLTCLLITGSVEQASNRPLSRLLGRLLPNGSIPYGVGSTAHVEVGVTGAAHLLTPGRGTCGGLLRKVTVEGGPECSIAAGVHFLSAQARTFGAGARDSGAALPGKVSGVHRAGEALTL